MVAKIISDRSKSFMNEVFQSFLTLCYNNAVHFKTSGFAPTTNGLTERSNKDLLSLIRSGCKDKLKFKEYLPVIETAYNSAHNIHLGASPHYILYGQNYVNYVVSLADNDANSIRQAILLQGLEFIRDQLELLRKLTHEQVTEARRKQQAKHNETASRPEYEIGQKVYIS